MFDCQSFLNQSFFDPSRLVYIRPEALPHREGGRGNISGILESLEESEDAELLKSSLIEWIDGHYPGLGDRLVDQSLGNLLDAAGELAGWDEDSNPSIALMSILKTTLYHTHPNAARKIMDRVSSTVHSAARSRNVKVRGARLISEAAERLDSPKLKELRSKLKNLRAQHDKYAAVTNKATIKFIKHEMILRKLLEGQGFQYDRKGEAENFYYFTSDYSVFLDERSPKMPQGKRSTAKKAANAWKSLGHHFDRSNKEVKRLDKRKEKFEADIHTEERKLKSIS